MSRSRRHYNRDDPMPRRVHVHDFDPDSGWCTGCNTRDDMRLLHRGGGILRPGHGHDHDMAGVSVDGEADA